MALVREYGSECSGSSFDEASILRVEDGKQRCEHAALHECSDCGFVSHCETADDCGYFGNVCKALGAPLQTSDQGWCQIQVVHVDLLPGGVPDDCVLDEAQSSNAILADCGRLQQGHGFTMLRGLRDGHVLS